MAHDVFCLCIMAPILEAAGLAQGVPGCSCTGWQLHFGFHWISACAKLSYNIAQHNAVAAVPRRLFREIGWEVLLKEQLGWLGGGSP